MTALRAAEQLQEEKCMESGCALFAALCEEDFNYSQPINETKPVLFELKP